jgi:hypothetical protein
MRRFRSAVFSVLLAVPQVLAAQDAGQDPLLVPGARVRVVYAGEDARTGTLIALGPDTLAVEWPNGATARMALTRVTRLEVSRGVRAANKAGRAKVGFAIGAALGVAIGAVSSKSNPQCPTTACDDVVNGISTAIGAGMLGGVGAAVGAVSGRSSEKWESVPLAPRAGVVMAPGADEPRDGLAPGI